MGPHMTEQNTSVTGLESASTDSISRQMMEGFADPEYRHVYVEEFLNTFLAFQIRSIREQREWTQHQLGERCHKKQAWISKLEDPNYGKLTLKTLKELARAFDVALQVRFVSFGDLSDFQDARYPGDLEVPSFDEEVEQRVNESESSDTADESAVIDRDWLDVPVEMLKMQVDSQTNDGDTSVAATA